AEMLDPIGGFERIRDFYITYLETAFRIRNPELQAERRRMLEQAGTLCTHPLFEPVPDYRSSGKRLKDIDALHGFSTADLEAFAKLANAGLVGDFEIYQHQLAMLERGVTPGHPGIVTSGTGSGKTESFLLPIFAALAKEARTWSQPNAGYLSTRWWHVDGKIAESYTALPPRLRPTEKKGGVTPFVPHRAGETRPAAIRAMILYPMNALVEDQLVRLRKALDSDKARAVMAESFGGNRIFLGRYTSATPVTNFDIHPRLSGEDENKRRQRKLKELFDAMVEMEKVQDAVRAQDKDAFGEDPRFLFPSVDGNELVTRWDMQATPPDIFITNTSMLNAILAREVDAPMIDKTRAWIENNDDAYFYLVLDELHLVAWIDRTEVA
ncbi:MAG: DEAD/DEAH box helicase, partial [bacterium]